MTPAVNRYIKKRRIFLTHLVYGVLFFYTIPGHTQVSDYDGINKDSVLAHISFLSSDALQGRGTGTQGERAAAGYIAKKLRSYGIAPAVNGDSYFQNIPMHGSRSLEGSRLRLMNENDTLHLTLNEDYLLYETGASTFIPNPVLSSTPNELINFNPAALSFTSPFLFPENTISVPL